MKFVDETWITVQSGDGGGGCVSFRREKYEPKGGPDGGDGGKGGDVILRAAPGRRTLYHFQFKRHFKAKNGASGRGKQKTGRQGEDLVIEVPPGTVVSDFETGRVLQDLTEPEQTFVAAAGGRGGRGNRRFATSTNRAPRYAQPGEPGAALKLKLELKLIADVGIIGLPNAGKSTLLRAVSAARPKVGDYPFTTVSPILGAVHPKNGEPFIAADIPGLIAGAHAGAGLGATFLRHIERTRTLLHLIDAGALDPAAPLAAFDTINREMREYSASLAAKPQIIALNKTDLPHATEGVRAFHAAIRARTDAPVMEISALRNRGVDDLISAVLRVLDALES